MQQFILAIPFLLIAAPLAAQSDLLSNHGRYEAVTSNGVVLPVQDVQHLLSAGLLRLDPVTRCFSLGVKTEAQFMAGLHQITLQDPLVTRDLYRSCKAALPNGSAYELTVPSGFGPAHFSSTPQTVALSASLGGVSRVRYTSEPDGALGFGLSFGNAFDGLGASVMKSFNDLNQLGNGKRTSWGVAVTH